jgi:hypothetical protein
MLSMGSVARSPTVLRHSDQLLDKSTLSVRGTGAGSLLYGEGSGGGFDVAEEGPEVVLVADDGQQFRAR